MIDEQKVVYETGLALSKKSSSEKKQVFIVEGGPGTGKSVVAINLLVELTKQRKNVQYVSKNAAPRAVYESKLAGTLKRTEIANLFSGSGTFFDVPENSLDVLVIDEAHRLNLKSGIFKNKGENQVKELIEACKCAIFFIDEDQKVTFHDVGTKEEIIKWANLLGAEVVQSELTSQFRCGGSDGYLSWLDNVLQIKETANINLEGVNYDFQIFDNPNELRKAIEEKNAVNNSARLVAGYCWDWVSKKDKNLYDVTIPEFDFKMKWNLADHGSLWIINKDSVSEVGCIHTCQGLEMDYVGVIVGGDLKIENEKLLTKPEARAKTDKSLSGYKKLLKVDPEGAKKKADAIIRNTYRALMTRGMKGCYVYFVDKEVEKYFKSRIAK